MSPGRYNLKLQTNEIKFENCSALKYFKNPYHHLLQSSSKFYPFVPSFVFVVLLKSSFTVLSCYFYISPNFVAIFLCLNLAKIRDTVPLHTVFMACF